MNAIGFREVKTITLGANLLSDALKKNLDRNMIVFCHVCPVLESVWDNEKLAIQCQYREKSEKLRALQKLASVWRAVPVENMMSYIIVDVNIANKEAILYICFNKRKELAFVKKLVDSDGRYSLSDEPIIPAWSLNPKEEGFDVMKEYLT